MTAKPVLVTSPNTAFTDQLNRKLSAPPTSLSPRTMLERLSAFDSVRSRGIPPGLDITGILDHDIAFPDNLLKDPQPSAVMPPNPIEKSSNSSAFNYSDILPHDLLSVTNFSPNNHPVNQGGEDGVYRGPFMVASHLEYDAKPPATFLDHISNFNDSALSMSTPQKAPMGIAGYLSSSHVQQQQPTTSNVLKKAQTKPGARRRAPIPKRKLAFIHLCFSVLLQTIVSNPY